MASAAAVVTMLALPTHGAITTDGEFSWSGDVGTSNLTLGAGTSTGSAIVDAAGATIGTITIANTANSNTLQIDEGGVLASTGGPLAPGVISGSSPAPTLKVTGLGTWNVTGNLRIGHAGGSGNSTQSRLVLDMSELSTFSVTDGLTVGDDTGATGAPASPVTAILAANSMITGNVNVGITRPGNLTGVLKLGSSTNIIHAGTIAVGGGTRGSGSVGFNTETGTLKIRGSNGAEDSRVTSVTLANGGGSTSTVFNGTIDLTGHWADMRIATLTIGNSNITGNTGSVDGKFLFGRGTLDVTTVTVASKSGAGTGGALGLFSIAGDASTNVFIGAGGIRLGQSSTAGTVANATLSITGGTLATAGSIFEGTQTGTVLSAIILDNSADAGATLDLGGMNIGSSDAVIENLDFRSGTLRNVGQINGGTTGFTKSTTGTLVLAGTNSFGGSINVSAGTLRVDGSTSNLAGISVAADALLTGNGTIGLAEGGSVTIASGATLTPGNSPGILTVIGSQSGTPATEDDATLHLAEGSIFTVELAGTSAGVGYDQISLTGTLALEGATLNVLPTIPLVADQFFTIVLNDGDASTDAVLGTFAGLPERAVVYSDANFELRITYTGEAGALSATGNDVILYTQAVPEPAMLGLAGLAGGMLLSRRRRRGC